MPLTRIVTRGLQRYWRLSRALTMGAQGAVIDANGHFLLIRHTYRPGWHFPGGGVEKGETIATALSRELEEEAGIIVDETPELFGVYCNSRAFPGDHIALFIVRSWRQPVPPQPNREIAEHRFYAPDALPDTIHLPTRQRIAEILGQSARGPHW